MIRKLMALALALALGAAALAEEALIAPAVELPVAEEEVFLGGEAADAPGFADFVGDPAVMAASGDVKIDAASFPDSRLRKAVEAFDGDGDGVLSLEERQAVKTLDISRRDVGTALGVELLPNLETLNCAGNLLTELDVSKNTALKKLDCSKNLLSALDVGANKALAALDCSGNRLSALNLSKNAALATLNCRDNRLSALDVSDNPALTALDCGENEALARLKLSANPDLARLACDGCGLKSLNVSANKALEALCCRDNALSKLNLAGNAALATLDCGGNKLAALDLSANPALETLLCAGNRLAALDLSANPALKALHCSDNALTELSLGGNTGLVALGAYGNSGLKQIDVTGCATLIGYLSDPWDKASLDYWAEDEPRFAKSIAAFGGDEEDCLWIDAGVALVAEGVAVYGTLPNSLKKAKITATNRTYTGQPLETALTVKLDGVKLKAGEDYTVEYANNTDIGIATATLTGAGRYTDSAEVTFKIKPLKVKGLKLKAAKGKLTVTWMKVEGVTGYRLRYGTKKDLSDAVKLNVDKGSTLKAVLKKLARKQRYYVSICSTQRVDGVTICSSWSRVVSLKTK